MIFAPKVPPEWDSDDANILKAFLDSKTGSRFLRVVAYECPPFEDGSDVNKTLVAGGKRAGYEEAFAQLHNLQTFQPVQPNQNSDNYPNLDDESKWPQETK